MAWLWLSLKNGNELLFDTNKVSSVVVSIEEMFLHMDDGSNFEIGDPVESLTTLCEYLPGEDFNYSRGELISVLKIEKEEQQERRKELLDGSLPYLPS